MVQRAYLPMGRVDAQGRVIPQSFNDLAFQADYQGGTNMIYKGFARPGTATTVAQWQIALLGYDTNGNLNSITWPQNTLSQASTAYEFQWSLRTTYTYS